MRIDRHEPAEPGEHVRGVGVAGGPELHRQLVEPVARIPLLPPLPVSGMVAWPASFQRVEQVGDHRRGDV
jgi:hypothetical protein